MARPFLILQLRPEADASDDEYAALLDKTGLRPDQTHRIRLDCEDLPDGLDVTDYAGVIVGGGPGCVSDPPDQKDPVEARIEAQILSLMPQITAADHPYMGCCYGLGVLAHHLGAEVSKARFGEPVGPVVCETTAEGAEDPLLAGLERRFAALVGHKEAVQALPEGAVLLAGSEPCPVQMIRYGRNVYATQFHPEANGQDFERRVGVYRNHGYFPPEEADRVIALCHSVEITVPGEILRRFAARYGG